jgi:type IV secretory pathway VirB10-like protein
MSGPADPPAVPPKEDPRRLVLRGRPRPAVRFRRGLIIGVTGVVTASLITLSWLAIEPPSFRGAAGPIDVDEPAGAAGAEALAGAAGSYGDVPRLGPPLPGDLGRPILARQRQFAQTPAPSPEFAKGKPAWGPAGEDQSQRLAAAAQAARVSPLTVQLASAVRPSPEAPAAPGVGSAAGESAASAGSAEIAASGSQRRIDFARSGGGDLNPHALLASPSPWILSAGSIIPASLITGLDSDLPGTVVAQVTENVRDSATGRTTLIPQGARLIGSYDSAVAFGQRRALVAWTRIVLPDGSSVDLDNMPAVDSAGYSGLADTVDSHGWQLLKGIGLSTLLGAGTQLSLGGSGSSLVRAVRESTQQNAAHAGDQITSRNLDVQPTIRVRPGWRVRAIVNKDLVLRPWRG